MFSFNKLATVLQENGNIHYDPEFWGKVSCVARLAWADTTQEAIKCGFNSIGIEEIIALIESTWSLITMEEDCDESKDNFFTPVGELISMLELTDILLSQKQNTVSLEKIF